MHRLRSAHVQTDCDDAARFGAVTLFRDDRILRAMIVRNEVPPAFVEWAER
jgi:hypothetical protein